MQNQLRASNANQLQKICLNQRTQLAITPQRDRRSDGRFERIL